jgi:ABC-type dipeptide/oligopeptide/nickel transport system permease component
MASTATPPPERPGRAILTESVFNLQGVGQLHYALLDPRIRLSGR